MATDRLELETALSKLIEQNGGDLLRNALTTLLEPQEALGESLCQRHLRGVSAWRLDSKGGEADGVDGRDRGEPQRGL